MSFGAIPARPLLSRPPEPSCPPPPLAQGLAQALAQALALAQAMALAHALALVWAQALALAQAFALAQALALAQMQQYVATGDGDGDMAVATATCTHARTPQRTPLVARPRTPHELPPPPGASPPRPARRAHLRWLDPAPPARYDAGPGGDPAGAPAGACAAQNAGQGLCRLQWRGKVQAVPISDVVREDHADRLDGGRHQWAVGRLRPGG